MKLFPVILQVCLSVPSVMPTLVSQIDSLEPPILRLHDDKLTLYCSILKAVIIKAETSLKSGLYKFFSLSFSY